MGVDFLKRINKSFHRALDRGEVALRTPSLLTTGITGATRTARANICQNAEVTKGERLLVRVINGRMIGQRENNVILEFSDPPAEYIERLNKTGGIELGEIKVVHPISEAVEVAFCDD